MKITWLGQAGLMVETCGKTVLIDPYLSDSVREINPKNYRRVPVDERFLQVKPDSSKFLDTAFIKELLPVPGPPFKINIFSYSYGLNILSK